MTEAAPETRVRHIRSRGIRIPRDESVLAPRIRRALRQNSYESKESDAVLRVVRPGDRVLELGGGIGYMSALLSVACKAAHVTTYEANPDLIPYMRRVHDANGVTNVEPRNALLMPRGGGTVPFQIRGNFLASSRDASVMTDGITREVDVPAHDVQEVLTELAPDILVCDIEGAEAELIPAADWSCLRAAVIELHPQWIGAQGVHAVFDGFMRAGLTYYPRASQQKVVCFRRDW